MSWLARLWDAQTRTATLTLVCVYAATLAIFSSTMILRHYFSSRIFLLVALPMTLEALPDALLYLLLRLTARRERKALRWALMVPAVLLADVLDSVWDTQLRLWSGLLWPDYANHGFVNGIIRAVPVNLYHSGMLVALFVVQEAYFQLRDHQRRLIAAQAGERDAHLAALRLQLNPHFLFNSMNALSSLVITHRNAEAETMIDRLSSFLRATLGSDPVRRVRLAEEFDMLEVYLEIEAVRFGERLETKLHLPSELEGILIPPFLLQPLVENAVKYAVAPARRTVCISVAAALQRGSLVLTVEDDGEGHVGMSGGMGVGLVNVRERLKLEFGEEAHFVSGKQTTGFIATIRLPVR